MNLDELSIAVNDILTDYLDSRWNVGMTTITKLFELLPAAYEADNPAILDLLTGAMAKITNDMHNISHGRIGANG